MANLSQVVTIMMSAPSNEVTQTVRLKNCGLAKAKPMEPMISAVLGPGPSRGRART